MWSGLPFTENLGNVVVLLPVIFPIALKKHEALTDAFVIDHTNALHGLGIIQMTYSCKYHTNFDSETKIIPFLMVLLLSTNILFYKILIN